MSYRPVNSTVVTSNPNSHKLKFKSLHGFAVGNTPKEMTYKNVIVVELESVQCTQGQSNLFF